MCIIYCPWRIIYALTLDNERVVVVVQFISSLPPAKIRCVDGLVLFVAYTMRFQNDNYIVDRKKQKNDNFGVWNVFAILTFWRHFVLAGTSRHAACTSRKIHTMIYCILLLTRNRRLATINYLLWCEYSPVMCPWPVHPGVGHLFPSETQNLRLLFFSNSFRMHFL